MIATTMIASIVVIYYERGQYNCKDYLIDYIYNKGKWCYLGHKCPIVFLCIVDVL